MSIVNLLQKIFLSKDDQIKIEDKYSRFSLEYPLKSFYNLESNQLEKISKFIPDSEESWTLRIIGENIDPITINNKSQLSNFNSDIDEIKNIVDIEDENITLKFAVVKNTSIGTCYIYNQASFLEFVEGLKTIQFLDLINENLQSNDYLYFKVLEETKVNFHTQKIIFYSNKTASVNQDVNTSVNEIKRNCYFSNQSNYPFSPQYFNLLSIQENDNSIIKKLDRLAYIFSIISIYDITSIEKEENLYYKINGYKSVEGILNIDETSIDSKKYYFMIYEWIYSNSSTISDKIGVARNILSLFLAKESISISEEVYNSIQSNYKIYIKDNLNKYIEIRNKLYDQLNLITQNASKSIESYLSSYQKSIFSFLSFFISVVVLRVLTTGDFKDVFTEDATKIAIGLIILSIVYWLFSWMILNQEINRIQNKYDVLKRRFVDLLDINDINRILSDDQEFNDELSYAKSKRKIYTNLWMCTLIVLLGIIFSTSTYINWYSIWICLRYGKCI